MNLGSKTKLGVSNAVIAYALNKTAVDNVNKVTDRKIVTINHAIHLKKI